jgi:hypothetical protein
MFTGCVLLFRCTWLTVMRYILPTIRITCSLCRTAVSMWRRKRLQAYARSLAVLDENLQSVDSFEQLRGGKYRQHICQSRDPDYLA